MLGQRRFDEVERIRGDGGLVFLANGPAGSDVESSEEQRHAQHRAARVSRHGAGAFWIEKFVDAAKERKRPHSRIFRGRESIKKDRVRFGPFFSSRRIEKRWKIANVNPPGYLKLSILKDDLVFVVEKLELRKERSWILE